MDGYEQARAGVKRILAECAQVEETFRTAGWKILADYLERMKREQELSGLDSPDLMILRQRKARHALLKEILALPAHYRRMGEEAAERLERLERDREKREKVRKEWHDV